MKYSFTPASLTIVFCFIAALCEGFDVQAAGVAASGLSREFRPSAEQLGLFFSASNFGLLLGAVFGGRLADQFGRKTVLVYSIATFGLFSLATSLGWSMESMTWMRFLTGLGLGGAMPNLIALAAEASDVESRNTRIATTYIGMPIGGVLASLIIAFIAQEHWRRVFLFGGLAPLLVAPAMAWFMPRSVAGSSALSYADAPHGRGVIRDLFDPERLRRTIMIWIGFFLIMLTLHLMLNWLPLLLQGRGLSKSQAALAQVAFNLGGAAAALLTGIVLDTDWRRVAIVASIIALPAALLLLANLPARNELMFGMALLLGGGILASQVILYGVAQGFYSISTRGAGIGAAVGAGRAGSITGPAFAALLIGAGRTPPQVLRGVLPIVVLCGACIVALAWSKSVNTR